MIESNDSVSNTWEGSAFIFAENLIRGNNSSARTRFRLISSIVMPDPENSATVCHSVTAERIGSQHFNVAVKASRRTFRTYIFPIEIGSFQRLSQMEFPHRVFTFLQSWSTRGSVAKMISIPLLSTPVEKTGSDDHGSCSQLHYRSIRIVLPR